MDNSNRPVLATTASVGAKHLADLGRLHRKVNATPEAARSYARYRIMQEECARRGLRFLPKQVLRPLYARDGLL